MEAFAADLDGKIKDLGLSLSSSPAMAVDGARVEEAITPDNADDLTPGSYVARVAEELVKAIPSAFLALSWPCPVAPSSLSEASLATFAKGLGFSVPFSGTAASNQPPVSLIVDFLVTELQAARFALARTNDRRPGDASSLLLSSSSLAAAVSQTPEASLEGELGLLCKLLSIPSSAESIRSHPARALMQVKARVAKLVSSLPPGALTDTMALLDSKAATPELLATLGEINAVLAQDYTLRREMLLQRVDVTVQSFLWSFKAEEREGEIAAAIGHKRRALTSTPAAISPADAFTAGPELTAVLSQRITDASTKGLRHSSVKGVIIGAVPDRGGRVTEMKVSARDLMPEWAARKPEGGGGGGGWKSGGHRGGGKAAGTSNREKDDRAKALLSEAGQYEGEARAAMEEYDNDGGADDDNDGGAGDGDDATARGSRKQGGGRGGRGRGGGGGWRGGRGRGR